MRLAGFLGSINVGGNRLKMADPKAALETAGFANVTTVVASGNVLFDHDGDEMAEAEGGLAKVIEERFGIATFAAVRSQAEIAAMLVESPFAGDGTDNLVHVHLLESQPSADCFSKLLADHAGRGAERITLGERALHVDYVDGVGATKLTGDFITRRLGCRHTARNLRSLRRIIEAMN